MWCLSKKRAASSTAEKQPEGSGVVWTHPTGAEWPGAPSMKQAAPWTSRQHTEDGDKKTASIARPPPLQGGGGVPPDARAHTHMLVCGWGSRTNHRDACAAVMIGDEGSRKN